jgi:hypothetical protein
LSYFNDQFVDAAWFAEAELISQQPEETLDLIDP